MSAATVEGTDGWYYRLTDDASLSFTPQLFDRKWIEQQPLPASAVAKMPPAEGRGAVWFFQHAGDSLVLKQYCRGGLPAKVTRDAYLWTGLERTRAWRDFNLLCQLHALGLNAPRPYACAVQQTGLSYRAFLITEQIDNAASLASRVSADLATAQSPSLWSAVGAAIATFHRAGVYHADLNASNILFDADDKVFLIDFDRSERRQVKASSAWPTANLDRLQRSLRKISEVSAANSSVEQKAVFSDQQWGWLMAGYQLQTD